MTNFIMTEIQMNEIFIVLSITATLFSVVALVLGCIALAMVVGLSRSTHTVQFKEVTPPSIQDDPFKPIETLEEEIQEEADSVLQLMRAKKKKPNHPVVNEEEITPEEPSAW